MQKAWCGWGGRIFNSSSAKLPIFLDETLPYRSNLTTMDTYTHEMHDSVVEPLAKHLVVRFLWCNFTSNYFI